MGIKTRSRETLALLNGDDKKAIIEYCLDKKLIQDAPLCDNSNCKFYKTKKMSLASRPGTADGFSWRCTHCTSHKSLKTKSFFEYFRSPISMILLLASLRHPHSCEFSHKTSATALSLHAYFLQIQNDHPNLDDFEVK